MTFKLSTVPAIVLAAVTGSFAQASDESPFFSDLSVGYQNALYSSGISVKKPISEKLNLQGVAGIFGTVNSFQARGLYEFNPRANWAPYAQAGVGMWSIDVGFASDTGLLLEAGVGVNYNLASLESSLNRWTASAELSAGSADFGGLVSNSAFGLGFGLHYKFN